MLLSKLGLIFLVLISQAVFAADILFLDMNEAASEVKAAEKAARERGDTLTVLPRPGETFSKEELKSLVDKNSYKSIAISGHGGAGNFDGTNGKISLVEVLDILEGSKSQDVESLYLMGCYTGNKSKVMLWKSVLPKLKFVAGFDSDAPLSIRPASPKYLYDLMKKEAFILNNNSEQALKKMLENVEVLKMVSAGLFIKCGEDDYSYISKLPAKKRFSKFQTDDCVESLGEYKKKHLEVVKKFWNGELEPTTENERTGRLRQAYSLARRFEHCVDPDAENAVPQLNADSVFHLLFNKAFNQNFSIYHRDTINELLQEIELAKTDPKQLENFILKKKSRD